MSIAAERAGDRPLKGMAFAMLTIALFACMDGINKHLAMHHANPLQLVWARYLIAVLLALPPMMARFGPRPLRSRRPLLQVARGVLLVLTAVLFISALQTLPIAQATAISFVAPLLVTALGIPLLGERVGAARWAAVLVGFGGVLIIVRPGGAVFDIGALHALGSSTCWALVIILTRKIGPSDGRAVTLAWGLVAGLAAASLPVALVWAPMAIEAWLLIGVMSLLHLASQYLMIRAYECAPVATLAPISYVTLVWTTLIGVIVFGTFPDGWTWAGAAVLVASGVFVWRRERMAAGVTGPSRESH